MSKAREVFDEILKSMRQARRFVSEVIAVGVEFADQSEEHFGVVLVEMAGGSCPYRVQWYDRRGFSGHSEVKSLEAAVELLVSDLGYEVKLAPGSMDRLSKEWR